MGSTFSVRGKDLYVENLGDTAKPALLYLHGGPGAGSYDFVLHQGERLSRHLRVVAFDQRGVLRSSPISAEDRFELMDLVEDCESLREQLGIERWSVLGHSFGGYLGLLYAYTYPGSVERLMFENSVFDLGLAARSLLRGAALEYGALGDSAKALHCLAAAFSPAHEETSTVWQAFTELTNGLGARRNSLYVHGSDKDFFEQLVENSPFPSEYWERAGVHQRRLYEEGRIFVSLLNTIVSVPHTALLLKGQFDHVLSADQIHAFISAKPDTRLVVFEESGHFIHVEEPDRFAAEVIRFTVGEPSQTGEEA